ncbi:MAG: hypothetical protein GY869_02330 [Planctomycetes bacterium]|nr:hypothetical protein [Planctomycetota bacterium]
MFRYSKNYRIFRRYQQIGKALIQWGFDEVAGRLNLFSLLKLKRLGGSATQVKKIWTVRFRLMIEQLGPSFIKLGQIISTRPDILPAELITELSNLQDQVTPVSWEKVKKVLPENFEQNFAEFSTKPIASASIAQVYKARLKTGEKVAVKIIRPHTEKTFKDDLIILEHLGSRIQTRFEEARNWDLNAVINQLQVSINHELDLRHEGRNADIFRANFKNDPHVYVPKIYWEHSSRHILVMEFIDGRPLSEYFDPETDLETRQTLARHGADIVLKQIFEHGFFQADPHPGNVFVMDGNVLCVLDFGMFGRLDQNALSVLSRVLQAAAKKDIDRLFKAARDLGVLPHESNRTELKVAVMDLIEQYHGVPLKRVDVSQLLRDIIQLVSRYKVGVRHDFLFLIKALGTIEATGAKLDPDFDMLGHAQPFVRNLVLKRFSPRHLLDESQRFSEDLILLARESPDHLLDILRQTRSGRLKIEFQHKGLEESVSQFNRSTDKVVLGLVLAALIIASAVMAHANIGPPLFGIPVIGGLCFVIATITGFWIVFDILRSRKNK